jgi:tRNA A37 threonylcarbamoyltransferase TsaD
LQEQLYQKYGEFLYLVGDATGASNPVVPYVSGGNTHVIVFSDQRYLTFGEMLY